jgi:hypothetical protein
MKDVVLLLNVQSVALLLNVQNVMLLLNVQNVTLLLNYNIWHYFNSRRTDAEQLYVCTHIEVALYKGHFLLSK